MIKKYCLFLAGGKWQAPLIKYLKQRGYSIVLVDPHLNCYCSTLAEIQIVQDVRNYREIIDEISKKDIKIEFVISDQTDVSTISVVEISNSLGLVGNSRESARRFTDKSVSRKFAQSLNLGHVPQFNLVSGVDEINAFIKDHKSYMLKPIDSQSSRGIHKLNSDCLCTDEILKDALTSSKHKHLLLEEFIEGQEITVEGICLGNKHSTLCFSDKKHFRTGIASDLSYPSKLDSDLLNNIRIFNDLYVQKSGLLFGITHAEYMVKPETKEFWLVEIACRGGGSKIPSHIVPWVTGIDVYRTYVDTIERKGSNFDAEISSYFPQKNALLHFFEFPSGKVRSISGLSKIEELEFVEAIELEFKVGDIISNASDDRSRQGYLIILADSETNVHNTLHKVNKNLKIEYEL